MHEVVEYALPAVLLGFGASFVMDAWTLVRKRLLGVPAPDYARVGRWLLGCLHGRLRLEQAASPVPGERVAGWAAHYLIGILFAVVLLLVVEPGWLHRPTLAPPLLVGLGSVVAPFAILQPALGAGWAGSRTPNPAATRLHSVVTHAVFGMGLYAAGWTIAAWL